MTAQQALAVWFAWVVGGRLQAGRGYLHDIRASAVALVIACWAAGTVAGCDFGGGKTDGANGVCDCGAGCGDAGVAADASDGQSSANLSVRRCVANFDCCCDAEICWVWIGDDFDSLVFSGDDPDCDGVATEWCWSYGYDSSGSLVSGELDIDCDRVADECTEYRYDEHGNLLMRRYRPDCIVVMGEDKYEYEYDEDGNIVRECNIDFTEYCWRCYEYEYDDSGRRIMSRQVSDCNVAPGELCQTFRCSYDGNVRTCAEDEDCDGVGDECTVDWLDRSERVTRREIQRPCGAAPYKCEVTVYDEHGFLVMSSVDSGCDGQPDSMCIECTLVDN